MKKFCKTLKILLILSGVGAVVCVLFKDKIKEQLFNSKYEDAYFKLLDVCRLALDLLSWPINWVKAILP